MQSTAVLRPGAAQPWQLRSARAPGSAHLAAAHRAQQHPNRAQAVQRHWSAVPLPSGRPPLAKRACGRPLRPAPVCCSAARAPERAPLSAQPAQLVERLLRWVPAMLLAGLCIAAAANQSWASAGALALAGGAQGPLRVGGGGLLARSARRRRRRAGPAPPRGAAHLAEELEQAVKDEEEAVRSQDEEERELGSVQTPASVWLPYKEQHDTTRINPRHWQFGPFNLCALARAAQHCGRLPGHIKAWAAFKMQEVMLGSTLLKLVTVFAAGLPACLAGGLLYAAASGKSLFDGFLAAYGALYKIPGVTVLGEVNAATSFLMNLIWIVGTFTFAILLGVVTEDMVNFFLAVRMGNYPVVATNHTLVLYWNRQTVPLLRQIALSRLEGGAYREVGPVVVMAEKDKTAMDEELKVALRGYPLEWHTRVGAPHCVSDLHRVGAGLASTIILLDPENDTDAGKKQVAAVLGIQTARASTQPRPFLRLRPQRIAIQAPDHSGDGRVVQAAQAVFSASAQKLNLTNLSGRKDMSLLLAQSAVQPGVASVYCSIVQQSRRGAEFYIRHFPELAGCTYAQARRSLRKAVLCGYIREPGDQLHINPPDTDVLHEDDRIIALAENGFFAPQLPSSTTQTDALAASNGAAAAPRASLSGASGSVGQLLADPSRSRPKTVVVAWWDDDFGDLARSLALFAPAGSSITLVAENKPKGFPEEAEGQPLDGIFRAVRFTHCAGNPASAEVLRRAGVASADSVIVAGVDKMDDKEADAVTLSMVMLLQDVLVQAGRRASRPLHVMGLIRRSETAESANYLIDRLAKGMLTAELLQPDEMVSGMIAQVAAQPDMAALLSSFIHSPQGCELYLRRPYRYGLPFDEPTSFAQLAELARSKGETAIGYITDDGAMRLAPPVTDSRRYQRHDRVVVIAED